MHARGKRTSADPSTLRLKLPEQDPALVEEYSWEWGNFPQKTPVWTAFGQAADKDAKGKDRGFFANIAEEAGQDPCTYSPFDIHCS